MSKKEHEEKTEEVYNGFMYVDTPLEEGESELTDPLLAVSELEQRVEKLEEKSERLFFGIDQHEATFDAQYHRITDLEERLRSLTLVVNTLVVCNENLERVVKDVLIAGIGNDKWKQNILTIVQKRKEGETN